MSLGTIYSELKPELRQIENQIEHVVSSHQPVVNQASNQLLKAGGKRIRPIFVLLSSRFGSGQNGDVLKVAVTLELIHMASLVHDDVIDDAELRRGKKTVKAEWDNRVAMYTGDFIFARALDLIGDIPNRDIHVILSRSIREMTRGEIIQIKDQYNWNQNIRQYFLRIKRKTALLMAVSCQLGGLAAGAPPKVVSYLYQYGYFIGMSYQIVDDILDFTSTEKQLGKPAGSDLRQGNVTLPTLLALSDPEIKDELLEMLNTAYKEGIGWESVIQLIKTSSAIDRAKEVSDLYLNKAFQVLEKLTENGHTASFREIANNIGKRKF
ncbi:MAG: polyprenyl synthetase family protein [Tuberibacillus sp.]